MFNYFNSFIKLKQILKFYNFDIKNINKTLSAMKDSIKKLNSIIKLLIGLGPKVDHF